VNTNKSEVKEKLTLSYEKYQTLEFDEPYIGPRYQTRDIALILHYTYGSTTKECAMLPLGEDYSFTRIRRALRGKMNWERIAVLNYLQRVLDKPGYDEIDDGCYIESEPGLRVYLDTHKPRGVLIFGVTHWKPVGRKFKSSEAIVREVLVPKHYGTGEIMIETVDHPSSWTDKDKLFASYQAAWDRLFKFVCSR
jgi:hypothetical protein